MNLSPDHRIAGVLTPLFALRSGDDLGIGDLATLREFIDWAAGVGFKLVQLLPINEIGGDNSPYNAISSMALEPTTLELSPGSPEDLTQADYEEVIAQFNIPKLRSGSVKYPQVRALKRALLERAFIRFETRRLADEKAVTGFQEFLESERAWLPAYAFFRALMEENGGRETWDQWPAEHQSAATAKRWMETESPETQARFAQRQAFFCYVQWVAYEQWMAAKKYADERGVALMGDIPFGVSYYSADVFAQPGEFQLKWSGGAPPEPYFKDDEFTQKWGQNWGIPLYDWEAMRRNDFAWWRQRIHGVRRIFHVFRIDHVLGFYRIYAFPWRPQRNAEFLPLSEEEMLEQTGGQRPHFAPRDDESPENAAANLREGEQYLRVALEAAASTRLVGEDLGTVPPYVRPNLQSLGIAGFKIPQWENRPDGEIVPGAEYERLAVATYATHDHKPLRGIWDDALDKSSDVQEQARGDLRRIAEFAEIESLGEKADYLRDVYTPAFRALLQSNAWMALIMITDLLARKDRFNVPGTAAESNWSRRLHVTVEQLRTSATLKRRMKLVSALVKESGRA